MAMNEPHRFAREYKETISKTVRRTCLEVATRLGDFLDDIRIVGGLVPSLIIDQETLPPKTVPHVGTVDLDLALSIAILNHRRYEEVAQRLIDAQYTPDTNKAGHLTSQRWRSSRGITIDFLIPPSTSLDKGGHLRNLDQRFAAIITPALDLAFEDSEEVTIADTLPAGQGRTERTINVCGAGAFTILKALAFGKRGKPKDAYDLYYILRYYGSGIEEIAKKINSFEKRTEVHEALVTLQRDFTNPTAIGPALLAQFLGGPNDELQADAAGFTRQLLDYLSFG